jgi:hypothetical protein
MRAPVRGRYATRHAQYKSVRPHPARRQLRRRQLRPTGRVVPAEVQSDRIAGEYAARSVGIPKPALASFWRWRAERRGAVALREGVR